MPHKTFQRLYGCTYSWDRTGFSHGMIRSYLGVIYKDNQGAIFLANNRWVGMRIKDIDIMYHFVRDLVGRFVWIEDNASDIMTKNVSVALFVYHVGNIIEGRILPQRDNVGEYL